jgi:hypothetical protein
MFVYTQDDIYPFSLSYGLLSLFNIITNILTVFSSSAINPTSVLDK